MPVKKSIINKDRFKNLSKISENEDEKENVVSRFDIDVKHESVSSVDVDKLKEAPSKWNFYSKLDDDKFLELVDSIDNNSLLHPIVVWQQDEDYMILSGHNRVRAYKKLYEITKDDKYLKIPAIIKKDDEITEDMAKEIIIDTNWIQRQLSTYEKTQSILQKYVKIKQSKSKGSKTRDIIASHLGITGRMVQNYISLNNLNTGFFEMLDDNLINIKQAIVIAKFDDYIQEEILKHKDKISFNIQLLKSALSIKNKDRVIAILSANDALNEEENYIKVVYKIPKDKKLEFDKIYKDFIKNF